MHGKMYLMGFGFLMPGSQEGPGAWLKNDIFKAVFVGGGYNPGLLGEFYINFGPIGTTLGMLFYGMALGYFLNLGESQKNLSVALSSVWTFYLLIALSPGLGNSMLPLCWNTIMGSVAMVVFSQNKRSILKRRHAHP